MRETCALRVNEDFTHLICGPDEGQRLGETVRKLRLGTDDPHLAEICRLSREISDRLDASLFWGWYLQRAYTRRELAAAELFHLSITAVFEPAGEECGTRYDESCACPHVFAPVMDLSDCYPGVSLGPDLCGAGRVQVGDLVLDLTCVPRTKDIARTIANEWIVSQRLADLLGTAGLTGFVLRPVRHRRKPRDGPVNLKTTPAGRELLRCCAADGVPDSGPAFDAWINHPQQAELVRRAWQEYDDRAARRSRGRVPPPWYQLVVTAPPAPIVPPTRTGRNLLDADERGRYRCPHGHVLGLNLLSEVFVDGTRWDGGDVACTRELLGVRRGLLALAPCLLISPRLRKLLLDYRIRGWQADVAYLR